MSREQIRFFIKGTAGGDFPDYQVSAMLMAIWFSGMDEEETSALTFAMRDSGETVDLSRIPGTTVDKHSTGGVADTTTLVFAPLAAACGLKVAKISGRGLGHTGGTLDKLESIPGFSTDLDIRRFENIVSTCGLSIIGQTRELAPADKKLYALRDVTCTVDQKSLIAASIMSKKLALGSDMMVIDIKTGSGSFIRDIEAARALSESMRAIGRAAGRKVSVLISNMDQPLGNAIGNALEVKEAITVLRNESTGDLKRLSTALAARMLMLSGQAAGEKEALDRLDKAIASGRALERFQRMIEAQGGNPGVCDNTDLLPRAGRKVAVISPSKGVVARIEAGGAGSAALLLGAGRTRKEETVDPAVGIELEIRAGDRVEKGDVLAWFHINGDRNKAIAMEKFLDAVHITDDPAPPTDLIIDCPDV